MSNILVEKEEVVIIGKSGTRTVMPSLDFAVQRAKGLWNGDVQKIEVKTTYIMADEKLFGELLDDVSDEILMLESDLANVGCDEVVSFIEDELKKLHRKKRELQHSLEVIDKN